MAELSLAPASDRSPLKAILFAVLVLAAIGFAVFWFNPHKVANAEITGVQIVAPHTQYGDLTGGHGAGMPSGVRVLGKDNAPLTTSEDNLYVVANVKLDNKLRLPIFISSETGTLTTADGQQADAHVIAARDLPRLKELFPQLAPMLTHPIEDGEQAAPGGSAQGQVVLLFAGLNEAAWRSKKAATLTLDLAHQDPLTINFP